MHAYCRVEIQRSLQSREARQSVRVSASHEEEGAAVDPTGAAVVVALEEGEPPGALGRSQARRAQAKRLSTAIRA